MLFQRLYNWIKYKTLPPSVLFKNRLFIERDSKHRRIFSNFGLTFRNSKWSNYEMYNVKVHFQWSYLRYLMWLVIFFIIFVIVLKFNKYYVYFYWFNTVAFFFWVGVDAIDYYLSFIVWAITIVMSFAINAIYSYFFFNNFSEKSDLRQYFSNPFFVNTKITVPETDKNAAVSKHDYSWILYSWLTNPKASHNSPVMENLFETKVNQVWWNKYFDFFIKLYRTSLFCNLVSERSSSRNWYNSLNHIKDSTKMPLISYLNNAGLLNKYGALTMSYILNKNPNYFNSKYKNSGTLSFLNLRNEWNILSIDSELQRNNFLLKTRAGMFFLENFNFSKLAQFATNFEELWTINSQFKNQINSAKWNRWLYRYSILHRKILKNSHKITISKRLINSGFYNNDLFDKNIWASENLKNLNKKLNFFNNASGLYYNELFATGNANDWASSTLSLTNNKNFTDNLHLLSFYETSYFWFIKRFYSFNTVGANFIKSSFSINSDKTEELGNLLLAKNSDFNKYSLLLSYALKSPSLNLYNLSLNMDLNLQTPSLPSTGEPLQASFNFKDLYNLLADSDLLNSDSLDITYWITSSPLNINHKVSFFDYLSTPTLQTSGTFYDSGMSVQRQNLLDLDYWLSYSILSADQYYLKDAYYFTIFF